MKLFEMVLAISLIAMPAHAETIRWFSVAESANLSSTGGAMDGEFSFELGVFKDNFTPTAANTVEWAENWVAAQRVPYNRPNQRFDGQFTVTNNTAPFTVGKAAYVWGFRGGIESSDWILFRAPNWTWPAPNPMNPFGLDWDAAHATAIVGAVNPTGNPFLAKASSIAAASPVTTWLQWREDQLAGLAATGPMDDPDHDGVSNIIEYVFGTPPNEAGALPSISHQLTSVASQRFMEFTLARRIDHPAQLTVEVSSDLTNWSSGPSATQVISNTPTALIVRDLVPVGPDVPGRFMRVKAEVTP